MWGQSWSSIIYIFPFNFHFFLVYKLTGPGIYVRRKDILWYKEANQDNILFLSLYALKCTKFLGKSLSIKDKPAEEADAREKILPIVSTGLIYWLFSHTYTEPKCRKNRFRTV